MKLEPRSLGCYKIRLSLGCFRRLGLQRVLGGGDQFVKSGRVCRGEVSQHFAVETDLRGLQASHETTVSHASGARGGVNANLPQHAIIALLGLAIAKSVLAAMIERIGCVTIK